jgi:hypothetical protein
VSNAIGWGGRGSRCAVAMGRIERGRPVAFTVVGSAGHYFRAGRCGVFVSEANVGSSKLVSDGAVRRGNIPESDRLVSNANESLENRRFSGCGESSIRNTSAVAARAGAQRRAGPSAGVCVSDANTGSSRAERGDGGDRAGAFGTSFATGLRTPPMTTFEPLKTQSHHSGAFGISFTTRFRTLCDRLRSRYHPKPDQSENR